MAFREWVDAHQDNDKDKAQADTPSDDENEMTVTLRRLDGSREGGSSEADKDIDDFDKQECNHCLQLPQTAQLPISYTTACHPRI